MEKVNKVSADAAAMTRVTSQRHSKLLWLVIGAVLLLLLHPNREGTDLKHYLAWTRSLAFDQDLLLINDFEVVGEDVLLTPTGYAVELHNVGTALLWLPFYILAHGVALLFRLATAGIESPYLLAVNFSTYLYGLLGLLLTYLTARRHFSNRAVWWAVGLVAVGSPLFYYTTSLPMNPHLPAFFLASLFVYLWDRYRVAYTLRRCFILGTLTGGLALVANNNVVLALLPLNDWLYQPVIDWTARLIRPQSRPSSSLEPAQILGRLATYGVGAVLVFAPQFIVWYTLYGSPLASPYARQLLWLQPQLWETLFSPFHGLLIYSPVLFLAIVGIFYLMQYDRTWGMSFLLAWLGLTYVNAANVSWWAGSSFGGRLFLALTPLFILSLAALFDRFSHWSLYVLGVGCVAWTFLLFLQTVGGLMNLHNYYPLSEMVSGQWQALRRFPQLLVAYLSSFQLAGGGGSDFQNSTTLFWVGLFVLTLVSLGLLYRWGTADSLVGNRYIFGIVAMLPVGLILFFALAAWRGNQARQQLQQSGFYKSDQVVTTFDFYDLVGLYSKRAEYNLELGRVEQAHQDVFKAAQIWPDRSRTLLTAAELDDLVQHRLDLNYSNMIRLIGYSLELDSWHDNQTSIRSGTTVQVHLFWERLAGRADTVNSVVQLFDSQGQIVGQGEVEQGVGPFPAKRILDGMYFCDTISLKLKGDVQIPFLARLQVSLPEDSGPPVTSDGLPHDGVVGLVEVLPSDYVGDTAFKPVDFKLGGKVTLAGYILNQQSASPGDTLQVALEWQAEQTMSHNYTVFVQFLDEADTVYAQRDKQPLDGTRPTASWQVGETILDQYSLTLPPELAPGQYRLDVGMYLLATGERLMLLDDQENLIDSRVKLTNIEIERR